MRAVILVALIGLASQEKLAVVQGTSGSRSDDLEVHAGAVVVREGEAGVGFGSARVGKGKRQLTYFVVFKHRLGGVGKSDFAEETTAEDAGGQSKHTILIDGSALQIDYVVKLGADKKAASQSLTVNKKALDLARGRVILADLTTSPVRWEQRKLDLPAEVPEATSKKEAEDLAKKVLAGLVKQDKKVKAFLDAAKR